MNFFPTCSELDFVLSFAFGSTVYKYLVFAKIKVACGLDVEKFKKVIVCVSRR